MELLIVLLQDLYLILTRDVDVYPWIQIVWCTSPPHWINIIHAFAP